MLNTDKAWKKWGKMDPYFAVLASGPFAGGGSEEAREVFFRSGRGFIKDLFARYQGAFGQVPTGRALDHGCGVGRLTLPLATRFDQVVAVDVSPDMLAEARANAAACGLSNVRFDIADDTLEAAEGEFDFVNSHMVLQHVPVRRGLPILLALVDKVRPGGGFHIHVSLRTESWPWRLLYWSSANVPGVKVWQNICAGRSWNAPAMQMNHYPLGCIVAQLARRGITELDPDLGSPRTICYLQPPRPEALTFTARPVTCGVRRAIRHSR